MKVSNYGHTLLEPSPDLDAVECPRVLQTHCEICGAPLYSDDGRVYWALCDICAECKDLIGNSTINTNAREAS